MESAAANVRNKRRTLIRKPLSDCTNTITSHDTPKTRVKSLITPSKILQSTFKRPQNKIIDKKYEERGNDYDDRRKSGSNNEPQRLTGVPSTAARLVKTPNKRKFVSTARIGESSNRDDDDDDDDKAVKREKMGSSYSDGFSSSNMPVTVLHIIKGDENDRVEAMAREAAVKREGKTTMVDDSFDCPQVERVMGIRDSSSNRKDVKPSKLFKVPPHKKQEIVRSDKNGTVTEEKETYEAFIKEKKAYFDEVDAFELMEEEEACSDREF